MPTGRKAWSDPFRSEGRAQAPQGGLVGQLETAGSNRPARIGAKSIEPRGDPLKDTGFLENPAKNTRSGEIDRWLENRVDSTRERD